MTCYFDGFVAFSMPNLRNNSQAILCLMLDICGWQFDREGPKSDACSGVVLALGVQFDSEDTPNGILKVRNTAERIDDATLLLETFLRDGRLAKKDALTLRDAVYSLGW